MDINILLLSNDTYLYNILKQETKLNIVIFKDMFDNNKLNEFSIFIFDNIKIEEIEIFTNNTYLQNNKLFININNFRIPNIINIEVPFNINNLLNYIDNFKNYILNNCIKINNCIINSNKNTLTYHHICIELTERESDIIKTIYENQDITKEELFKIVSGYEYFESKAIDTLIYNIKTKLRNHEIDDFILFENGIYKIKK